MKKLYIIILLFYSVWAQAQQVVLDSLNIQCKLLRKNPQTIPRDSLIVDCFAAIWDKLPYEDFDKLKKVSDTLAVFAAASKYDQAIAISDFIKCRYYFRTGQYSIAISLATKILEVFKKKKNIKYLKLTNILIASVTGNSLRYYSNILTKKEIEVHFKHLDECNKIVKEYGDVYDKSKIALMYAFSYLSINDFKNSYKYYKSSADIIEADSAKQFYAYYNSRWAQGLNLLYLNKKAEGFALINKVYLLAQKPREDKANMLLLHNMNLFMAEYYLKNQQADTCIVLAKKAIEYSKDKGNLNLFQKIGTELLYKAYEIKGDYKAANKYLNYLIEYAKSDEIKNFNQNVSEWQVKYDDEKKQSLIKTLENEKLKAEVDMQRWVRNFLIISLLAGLGFVFYFYRNNQKLLIKNAEIEEALLKGQTIERKRVAQELHDNLSAKISGIRWRLEAIAPHFDQKNEETVYKSSVNALAEVYTDVRLIAHNLLPDELETKGLKLALQKLIEELNSLGKTHFADKIDINLGRFTNKIEYEVYSCILELSNNILKHAKATAANIQIVRQGNILQILVQDNGAGLKENFKTNGMGMHNIQSRVTALKGEVRYDSTNGLGVHINIPIL